MSVMIRREECESVRHLLDRHGAVAVVGQPGFGASEILVALGEETEDRIVTVPNCRTEAGLPYSGLDIVLSTLRAVVPTGLGDLEFEGAEAGLPQVHGVDGVADCRALDLASRVTRLIRDAAPDRRTLVVIDGADDMDGSSQEVLGHVLRRIPPGRLCFVVSVRVLDPTSPLAGIPEVEIGPLDEPRLRDIAVTLTAGRIAPDVAEMVVRTASGRVDAVEQILDQLPSNQLRGEQALTLPLPAGAGSSAMVAGSLGGLGADLNRMLDLLSLAPIVPVGTDLGGESDSADRIADLEARGIVERHGAHIAFRDELVRSHCYWRQSHRARSSGHAALVRSTDDAAAVHWHSSFVTADGAMPGLLLDDAVRLIGDGFILAGVEFAERALVLSPRLAVIAVDLNRISVALIEEGKIDCALRYLDFVEKSGAQAETIRARSLRVWAQFLSQQSLPARLHQTWSRSDAAAAPGEVGRLQLTIGACYALRREFSVALEFLAEAEIHRAHLDESAQCLAESLHALLVCTRGHDRPSSSDSIEADLDDHGEPLPLLLRATGLMLTEHYDSALAVLDRVDRGRCDGGIRPTLAGQMRAEVAIRRGDVRSAIALIGRGRNGDRGSSVRRDRELLLQSWSLLVQGRASDAEEAESELMALATASRNHGALAELNAIQGNCLLRAGLPTDAIRHLRRCEELTASESNPNVFRYEPDLIEALVGIGRREHAGMLIRSLCQRAESTPSRWAQLAADRSRALAAPDRQSVDALGRILGSWRSTDSQYDRGVVLLLMAKRLAALGAMESSASRAQLAEAVFREVGAARPVAQIEPIDTSTRPEAPAPAFDGLTAEESAVVELVRAGLKNREIAGRIFVSLRTVELRLTSVYRKLDVASRTELLARLAGYSVLSEA